MKHIFTLLFVAQFFFCFSQTVTIRVSRPSASGSPDPMRRENMIWCGTRAQHYRGLIAGYRGNYTFKGIQKFGFQAEVLYRQDKHFYIGLQYSRELETFPIAPYDQDLQQEAFAYANSVTQRDFLKVPFGVRTRLVYGTNGTCDLFFGMNYEYMFACKNQYGRIGAGDFNRNDLNMEARLAFPINVYRNIMLNFTYSRDLLDNLRNGNLYNEIGRSTGRYGSKTNLFSVGLSYQMNL